MQPPTQGWHLYSASDVRRFNVIHVLVLITAVVGTVIVLLMHFSDWIGVVIAAVLLWLILFGFDRRAWRWRVMALVPHCTMPDLTGQWLGDIVITQRKKGEPGDDVRLDCRVTIRQDWSRIRIDFETDVSRSWSVMASVNARRSGNAIVYYELHYEYYVIPKSNAPGGLVAQVGLDEPHYGTARLKFQPGPRLSMRSVGLRGIWFNDHHFQRWGDITLTRDL